MARTGRTERGRATRARIGAAAGRLFLRDGYLDTTMASIAAEADVAIQTLYLAFGSKVAILAACHDVAVVGDEQPIPVLERPWVADVAGASDARRALDVIVEHTLDIIERVAPIQWVIRGASADPEVAELQARNQANRYLTLRSLVDVLAARRDFDASVDRAADLLYAFISEELHHLLVVERQWPPVAWRGWVKVMLVTALFTDALNSVGYDA